MISLEGVLYTIGLNTTHEDQILIFSKSNSQIEFPQIPKSNEKFNKEVTDQKFENSSQNEAPAILVNTSLSEMPDLLIKQEDGVYQCGLCYKLYTALCSLKLHIKTIHEGIKKIVNMECPVCKKIFTSKSHLNVHVKAVHEGIKDFKCEQCDKAFGDSHKLTKHILSGKY